jgi:uncharacterized repeat protein (TIGR03803 family)
MEAVGFAKIVCIAAVFGIGTATASPAQTFTVLSTFSGPNGADSVAPLVQATDGNFYGTTEIGGMYDNGGTIFRVTPDGKLGTIYNFCPPPGCTTGMNPFSGLAQAPNGNLYGTAAFGGTGISTEQCGGLSCGTVFEITPAGKLTALYNFCSHMNRQGTCTDGAIPRALALGPNGNVYGVTLAGGTGNNINCGEYDDCGTIFEITPSGALTTLHNFCLHATRLEYCPDGANPNSLVVANDGNFYGTTPVGGSNETPDCTTGCGAIFRITPAGKFSLLFSFCFNLNDQSCQTGAFPQAALIQGTDGNLYGTTRSGGAHDEGTVFRVTLQGQLTTLYSFCAQSNCTDGENPEGALVQGTDGNFYGTTMHGGTNSASDCLSSSCGIIFELSPSGNLTTLYNFCSAANCTDGALPLAGLVQGTDGIFYGTSSEGGDNSCTNFYFSSGCGTVFALSTGLAPFVEANPNYGAVGRVVNILGNNLTGATSVTFNGVAAMFNVISNTYLKAEVPSGATTGTIEVTTPSGTLNSSVAFQVLQ